MQCKITKEDEKETISERYLLKDNRGEFGFNHLTQRIEIVKEYNEITLQELQAINEKVKELKWNE